jgi:hypothetical protein
VVSRRLLISPWVASLDGQAEACPYLMPLLRGGALVDTEKQIPFGNDSKKSKGNYKRKSKDKGSRRPFDSATITRL